MKSKACKAYSSDYNAYERDIEQVRRVRCPAIISTELSETRPNGHLAAQWTMIVREHIVKPSDVPLLLGWQIVDEVKSIPPGTVFIRWVITTSQVASHCLDDFVDHSALDDTCKSICISLSASNSFAVNTKISTIVSPIISVAETSISAPPITRTNITVTKTSTAVAMGGRKWTESDRRKLVEWPYVLNLHHTRSSQP